MDIGGVANIITPDQLINGVLIKVRKSEHDEVKLFGMKDGEIVYLEKEPEGLTEFHIPLDCLRDESLPSYKLIWGEIQKYQSYKMLVHGRLR